MKIEQFDELLVYSPKKKVISADDLVDKRDRTLIYGYGVRGIALHVYLNNGDIYAVMYHNGNQLEEVDVQENEDYVPYKRSYPEACDFEFCKLLRDHGLYPTFTRFDEERKEQKYYGEVLHWHRGEN